MMNPPKLSYVLSVTHGNFSGQLGYTAYQFACAVVAKGHKIKQIFFHLDGVIQSSSLVDISDDEFNLIEAWSFLATTHHIELDVCITAGERRGIVDQNNIRLKQLPELSANLKPPFKQSGLTALAEALLTADRYLKF